MGSEKNEIADLVLDGLLSGPENGLKLPVDSDVARFRVGLSPFEDDMSCIAANLNVERSTLWSGFFLIWEVISPLADMGF